jgi:hypothetical protein
MANTTKTTTIPQQQKHSPRNRQRRGTRPQTPVPGQHGGHRPRIRQQMIAEAAYLRAEQRGFSAGDPLDDWLAAEREVDLLLAERASQLTQ